VIPLQAWQSTIGDLEAIELKPGVWRIGDHILKRTSPLGSAHPSTRLLQYCEILAHLGRSGIPVGVPRPTDDGHPFAEYEGELYILSPYLAGPDLAETQAQFEHSGAAIARLHQALATCPTAIDSWQIHLAERTFGESWPGLEARLPAAEFERLSAAIDPVHDEMIRAVEGLPSQRIHGDCHAGNILLTGDEVTGFIDLDHLPIGPRMYDLGYFLSCSLITCTDGGEAATDALERLSRPLFAGYRSVLPLTERETAAILPIMLYVQLILADWYLQAGISHRADRALRFTRWAAELDWCP
jgi:Ser/Thr protein kinase RdoA (MazF antagonist)